MAVLNVAVTVRDSAGLTGTGSAVITTTGTNTIPLSYNDPIFNGTTELPRNHGTYWYSLASNDNVTLRHKDVGFGTQFINRLIIGINCTGTINLNKVRLRGVECFDPLNPAIYNVTDCYMESGGLSGEHPDTIQIWGPTSPSTVNITRTCLAGNMSVAAQGTPLFVADKWQGNINLTDVVFKNGRIGCGIYADAGCTINVRFKNVFFVGPWVFPGSRCDVRVGEAGGVMNILQWENVRDATISNGVLVPGSLIPRP